MAGFDPMQIKGGQGAMNMIPLHLRPKAEGLGQSALPKIQMPSAKSSTDSPKESSQKSSK